MMNTKFAIGCAILLTALIFKADASTFPSDKQVTDMCYLEVWKLSAYPDYTTLKPQTRVKFEKAINMKEMHFRLQVNSPYNVPIDDDVRCRVDQNGKVWIG
ncbi:hypothetical protein [Yersinia enterocolitica]|uniref:hypothetical protein n=1 Tax=Yersinia enterocolitica TaxID=630 RepID=UPI000DDB919E|nr:hypothetical protein [Yersinia enterocolitica]HDM8271622.1 hypothetical protein [Yersinia enterocolitica]HED5564492.1 hypothetical protein [Yersinia enterocolitica]